MTSFVKKRKKNSRMRGSNTHGWGAMKKHRGAGHRGGRGNAGSGKRGDGKKPSYWKQATGKHGFVLKKIKKHSEITIGSLDILIEKLVTKGLASKENDKYSVDLSKTKKTKLLSNGETGKKMDITVFSASVKAVEKIKKAGGNVNLLRQPVKDKKNSSNGEKKKTESRKKEQKDSTEQDR